MAGERNMGPTVAYKRKGGREMPYKPGTEEKIGEGGTTLF